MMNERRTAAAPEALIREVTELRAQLRAAETKLAALGVAPPPESPPPGERDCLGPLLDTLPGNVALLDAAGAIVLTNKAWDAFAIRNGVAPASAGAGLNYLELCRQARGESAGKARECLKGLEALLAGRIDHFNLEYACHTLERKRWFVLHARAFRFQRYAALLTHLDVSRDKRVELELQQRIRTLTHPQEDDSSVRFEDLFDIEEIQKIQDAFAEATGVASLITDLNGRPITRPSRFCRLCNDIIRKTELGLRNCMCSDAALGRKNPDGPNVQPCLSGGLWDGGTSICVGDRHIANWLIGQVLDETQKEERMLEYGRQIGADPEAYRGALREVTRMPRERFEKICLALHQIAKQLSLLALKNVQQARAITERNRVGAELLEADRRKDEFLAMLSHELRNPLAPIRNAVQILRLSGGENPVALRQREIIDRQVTHMARLLDDLLDVSRITRGKIRLKWQRLDLRAIADHAIETVAVAMSGRGQRFIYSPPQQEFWVDGDATRLEQVLCNLLHNASKYSDPDARIWLTLGAAADGREALLEVRDEGVGIAPEMLPHIFDIFTQADQALDRAQGGLGIGLTLVKRLVEMHGGSVRVSSAGLGRGSAFEVRLPLLAHDRLAQDEGSSSKVA